MKRMLIAIAIVLAILGSSSFTLWRFYRMEQEAAPMLQAMQACADSEDLPEAVILAEQFRDLWTEYQPSFVRVARRDSLERIGRCAARLPALGQHGDSAEFAAAVQELAYCINELWESELPLLRNLF